MTSSSALRQVDLPGRRVLAIRPMTRDDGPGLVALYAGLDEEDCYLRFFGAHPPSPAFVDEMAAVAARGGGGLVATISTPAAVHDGGERAGSGNSPGNSPGNAQIVAEATYELLSDGDGELGITVAAGARGWLGPYLLDALIEMAAERGVPTLQADVLLVNTRMLTMLRHRGMAVIRYEGCPATARLSIPAAVGRRSGRPSGQARPVAARAGGDA